MTTPTATATTATPTTKPTRTVTATTITVLLLRNGIFKVYETFKGYETNERFINSA